MRLPFVEQHREISSTDIIRLGCEGTIEIVLEAALNAWLYGTEASAGRVVGNPGDPMGIWLSVLVSTQYSSRAGKTISAQ